jgi:hypothetical protein
MSRGIISREERGAMEFVEKLLIPLLLLLGQLWLNQRFKVADERREEARAETTEKRAAEAQWRERMAKRLDQQDERIGTILAAQCSQMRSDILHKAHRYVDDLGCASTEEKESLWAEYKDYSAICDANNITNHFADKMVNQVMQLPSRGEKQ